MPVQVPEDQDHRRLQERRRHMRGLVLLAMAALLFSLLRAGLDKVFMSEWWRL